MPDRDRIQGVDRRLLLAGLGVGAFSWSFPVLAQDAAAPSQGAQDPPPIQLLSNLFTRVAAAVMINGQGPFTFVIDTGAGATSVADTLAERLHLPGLEPLLIHGITAATITPSAAMNRLVLNGMNFRNLRCPVLPHDQLGADGLLGLDVLGKFRLRFDIVRRSANLTLSSGVSVFTGGGLRTGTRIRQDGVRAVRGRFGQLILTEATVEGRPVAAFIDSGAQYSIGNIALRDAIAARRVRTTDGGSRSIALYGVTGQSLQADLARVDDLRLGASRLGVTPLLFADLHCFRTLELHDRPALLIGADLLGRFRDVSINFPENTIQFTGLRRQTTQTIEEQLT